MPSAGKGRNAMKVREIEAGMAGKAFRGLLLALFFFLLLLPVLPSAKEAVPGTPDYPHSLFRSPDACRRCHSYRQSFLEPDRFVPGADSLCLGCHSLEGLGTTHPMNVRPGDGRHGMAVPKDLRLDGEGRMLCLTCHIAHGPFLSPVRAYAKQKPSNPADPAGTQPLYRTFFARRSDPVRGFVPLCEACHGNR